MKKFKINFLFWILIKIGTYLVQNGSKVILKRRDIILTNAGVITWLENSHIEDIP